MASQRQHDRALTRTRQIGTSFPEVRGILTESYRKVAPKTLVELLGA